MSLKDVVDDTYIPEEKVYSTPKERIESVKDKVCSDGNEIYYVLQTVESRWDDIQENTSFQLCNTYMKRIIDTLLDSYNRKKSYQNKRASRKEAFEVTMKRVYNDSGVRYRPRKLLPRPAD